ncbi:MAG TPA: hypothetical protein VN376_03385, partial [Longilinea sp.]|nr:hypothetical protein [Longilinea sp.]
MTETMQWSCDKCHGEGDIPFPFDCTHSKAIVCTKCNTLSAYHWCDKCGFGGQIAEKTAEKESLFWVCQQCKTRYELLEGFYDAPIVFTPVAFAPYIPSNKYDVITIGWLKKAVLLWEKYRVINMILMFAGLVIMIMIFLPEGIRIAGGIVMLLLFFIQILLDIPTVIILEVFWGIY